MLGHLVGMTLKDVHYIHDVVMGMAVIFNLGLMLGHDFCNLGKFMQLVLCVRRQHDPHRQSDGQCKAQE